MASGQYPLPVISDPSYVASSNVTERGSLLSGATSSLSATSATSLLKRMKALEASKDFYPQFAGFRTGRFQPLFYTNPEVFECTKPPGIVLQRAPVRPVSGEPALMPEPEPLEIYTKEQLAMWHPYADPIALGVPPLESTRDSVKPETYLQLSAALREQLKEKEQLIRSNNLDVRKERYSELVAMYRKTATELEVLIKYTEAYGKAKMHARQMGLSESLIGPIPDELKPIPSLSQEMVVKLADRPSEVSLSLHSILEQDMATALEPTSSIHKCIPAAQSSSSLATALLIEEEEPDTLVLQDWTPNQQKKKPRQRRRPKTAKNAADADVELSALAIHDQPSVDFKVALANYRKEIADRGLFRHTQKQLADASKAEYFNQLNQLSSFDKFVCNAFSGVFKRTKKATESAKKFATLRAAVHRSKHDHAAAKQWEMISWDLTGELVEDVLYINSLFTAYKFDTEEQLWFDAIYRAIVFRNERDLVLERPIHKISSADPSINIQSLKSYIARRQEWLDGEHVGDKAAFDSLSPVEKSLYVIQGKVEGYEPLRAQIFWRSTVTELSTYHHEHMRQFIPKVRFLAELPSRVIGHDVGCIEVIAQKTANQYSSLNESLFTFTCVYLQQVFTIPSCPLGPLQNS